MSYLEFKKNDLIDESIEVLGMRDGGIGRVYFGYCRNRQTRVAIKTVLPSIWDTHEMAERWPEIRNELTGAQLPARPIDVGEYLFFTFFREARLVCQSRNHPNLIKGTRFWWTESGQPFYECEFVENSRNLKGLMKEIIHPAGRRLSVLEAAHVAVSFANGMIYVSNEMLGRYNRDHPDNQAIFFVHRDIKPENILIDDRNLIKIIDLGLAKFVLEKTESAFVSFPIIGGSYEYMAPEQIHSFEAVLPSSDIYSLGATLTELLGRSSGHEFHSGVVSHIVPQLDIPEQFKSILDKCLDQDMTRRYQDFRELKVDLIGFISKVKAGRVSLNENLRCQRCGWVSSEYAVPTGRGLQGPVSFNGPAGHQMVRVPAGYFYKGCPEVHAATLCGKLGSSHAVDNEPYKLVFLEGFEIDTYAVTNRQYWEFVRATGHGLPPHWKRSGPPFPESEADLPVVNVSYEDANKYCHWAGLRLPTGDEWEKAARGEDGRLYPWGDQYDPAKCNSSEARHGGPVPVDRYPEGCSPHGCYQMVGNVFEWVDESHHRSSQYKYLRGGSWAVSCEVLGPPFMHYIASKTTSHRPSSQADIFGFRCARNAEEPVKAIPKPAATLEPCPLCGGDLMEFTLGDIKVPEKNIYTWMGYFDIED